MSATTLNKTPIILVILAMVIGVLALLPYAPSSHSISKHGEAGAKAEQCLNQSDAQVYFNPETNRKGIVCMIQENLWAVVIICVATGCVITAFCKEKLNSADKVDRYMKNRGYTQK